MTIADLKELISDLPDDMEVVCPLNAAEGFDGMFFSPCIEESGVADFGVNPEDAEKDEVEELMHPSEKTKEFMLVPCGFFELHEEREKEKLN